MTKQTDIEKAKKGDLIRYWLNGNNTPLLYNDVQVISNPKPIPNGAPSSEAVPDKAGKEVKTGPTAKTFNVTGIEEW